MPKPVATFLTLSLCLVQGAASRAHTGNDPVIRPGVFARCQLNHVRARLGADGASIRYFVLGSCGTQQITGEMAFRDGVFQEKFDLGGSARLRTRGRCDRDPWSQAARCEELALRGEGPDADRYAYDPYTGVRAPLSVNVPGAVEAFQRAFVAAERPLPPHPPVGVRVTRALGNSGAHVAWHAPDESGDRPYLHFQVETRPAGLEGAPWTPAGAAVPRGKGSTYAVTRALPVPAAGNTSWDVRVCAATALASTCSAPHPVQWVTGVGVLQGPSVVPTPPPTVATSVGRIQGAPRSASPLSVCEQAAAARDRGSPAAAALAEKCRASGGEVAGGGSPAPPAIDLDHLAAVGEELAAGDPLATRLRESLLETAARRGFDVGLGSSAGQTEWGPGKQRILDSLPQEQRAGYETAVTYALDRNRHRALAAVGATIAETDGEVAAAREREADARYALGFDIASGIFGDPAQGAQGNTQTGPGSLGVRKGLSAPAQRGFDAAVTLHLSRTYPR